MPDERVIRRRIQKTLEDVERIHALVNPLDHEKQDQNLFSARTRREDAVRMSVLQMSLAIEDVLDGLFKRTLLGYNPSSPGAGYRKRKSELDELLESGRIGFESKVKLAWVLRVITKNQLAKLDKLRVLRNKCAHAWVLDVVHKRARKPRPTKHLLEYRGQNLFDFEVLKEFVWVYSRIYLKLYSKYRS